VRAKFVPPAPAAGGGGGFGGRGGGPPPSNDISSRVTGVKTLLMAFQDNPSEVVTRRYNELKLEVPKAIQEGNAFIVRAMTLSQALKKSNLTLTVPAPVK
jgi:hypothetical protein